MLGRGEYPEPDTGSPRQQREFSYPSRSGTSNQHVGGAARRESESGQDSSDLVQRRESLASAQRGLDVDQENQQEHQRLRRSEPAYDDEGEPPYMGAEDDEMLDGRHHHQLDQRAGRQQIEAEQQRRQSINDRLTGAVSDVMEFVRDESNRRGKRRSMIRRRGGGGGTGSGVGSGFSAGSGSGGAGPLTDEADFDSEELGPGGLIGVAGGIGRERSPNYRRRRTLRRSLRRTAQTRHHNDSDTGSGASLAHEQVALMIGPQQHQQMAQRYKLQQHGGSMQDGHPMYRKRNTALLIEQHRRHQSADLHHEHQQCDPQMQHQMYYHPGRVNIESGYGAISLEQVQQPVGMNENVSLIRPIMVGASPPPLIGSAEADLVAARRKRAGELEPTALRGDPDMIRDEDEETAIHVGSGSDGAEQSGSKSPGRFIAPKVVPLNSPSAQLIPDEEIVPPNVPFRGRRLPQIPGSGIIKSAAEFLHSSIYGGRQERAGLAGARSAVTATPVASTPLIVGGQYGSGLVSDEPEFPSVSESPTVKQPGSVHQSGDLLPGSGIVKKPLDALCSASFDSTTSINFPRVSFSPTHTVVPSSSQQQASVAGSKYHHLTGVSGPTTTAASMIATQAAGGGPQSTVLAASSSVASGEGAPMTTWAARTRRGPNRDDEDDWF